MSTLRLTVVLGTLALVAACGEPTPATAPVATHVDAAGATVYGSPLATAETLGVGDVVKRAAELDGKPVRVEGTVVDVCSKRGCWIRIGEEAGPAEIVFKVEDGVMTFPMSAKGKWAVADGTVRRRELTLEQTRARLEEEAKEAGKPFDPAAVTQPKVSVRLEGIGARIRDRK